VLVSVVKQLYLLQLVDREWEDKDQRLEEVHDSLGESGELIQARQAVTETEEGLGELRRQLRALELEIAGVEAKLKKNQERLYSGRVRNPKELSNLQEEAAALRRRRAELEDTQLELMIAIEEEEAELAERQARLRQIEATWREAQADLLSEREQLELRLVELEEQREQMRAQISAADLYEYDDLRARFGGLAVVLLKRGICQTCGVDVPTGVARAVERGEGLHYCPTCNRLLYAGA
jgi:predicted  nucleic acid-binding Zn-ribbon protein